MMIDWKALGLREPDIENHSTKGYSGDVFRYVWVWEVPKKPTWFHRLFGLKRKGFHDACLIENRDFICALADGGVTTTRWKKSTNYTSHHGKDEARLESAAAHLRSLGCGLEGSDA